MTQLSADILKIQRFSINDGPGIRTTVFFKGCPLRCAWCHNPDSIGRAPQLMLARKLCTACGACVEVCPQGVHRIAEGRHEVRFDKCLSCGACVEACPASALTIQGEKMDVGRIMEILLRDRAYYDESGGGLTASGGEPMMQHEFTTELFRAARAEGIGTALDTSGFCPTEIFGSILPLTDHLLLDIKTMDGKLHKRFIGADNDLIHKNFHYAVRQGVAMTVRHVVVPGVNDTTAENEALAGLLLSAGFSGVLELLPFHSMARAKYEDLGIRYTMDDNPVPTPEAMERTKDFFMSKGIKTKIN